MEKKDYFVGVDIGTSTLGWAVTDTKYNILKDKGDDFWGTYLFDSAQTAAARRGFRCARRRAQRVRKRMELLRGLFAEEINKIDPTFFARLDNSSYRFEDKEDAAKVLSVLFADENFDDKAYFEKYKTIYHLRKACLDGEVSDVRLLYLAVKHIVKNRGHFIFEGQNFTVSDKSDIKQAFADMATVLYDDFEISLPLEKIDEVLNVLLRQKNEESVIGEGENKRYYETKSDKAKIIKDLFNAPKGDKTLTAISKLICGCTISTADLYQDFDGEPDKLCFSSASFDEQDMPALENAIGIDETEIVRLAKTVYDWVALNNILDGEKCISVAKVKVYEKHKKDLELLRNWVKSKNNPKLHSLIFHKPIDEKTTKESEKKSEVKVANYSAYIGKNGNHACKRCSKDEFYKFLKSYVKVDDEYILSEIEKGTFLPKQVTADNGVIPYQVHLYELQEILKKAEPKFPFLKNVSDSMTVSEKIEKLMTFRIPYYVGPLKTRQDGDRFNWVVKKDGQEKTSVTPWNFDDVIDRDASEKIFIERMTNNCTYILGEKVLPANSILYNEYVFLNELNNLRVYGEKNLQAKTIIYERAKDCKKVTLKMCLRWLKEENLIEQDATVTEVFTGLDEDFKNSLSVYKTFKDIVGELVDTNREMCEDIISMICVMQDKSRLEKSIKEKYGKVLSGEAIRMLKGLNYSKWGRLSKKLLTGITAENPDGGETLTVIEALRDTTYNFMEIYHNFGFKNKVDELNAEYADDDRVTYRTVENLYCSPSVKRAIWRTLCLVKEIVDVKGYAPKKIFVEMARDNTNNGLKGKRTVSRKQKVLERYKEIYAGNKDLLKIETEKVNAYTDKDFNSGRSGDVLYLYFMQNGICAYTGKPIDLEQALNSDAYFNRDHIYPQSKVKDDSLDNLVLVDTNVNQTVKKEFYPVPEDIRKDMSGIWKRWLDEKRISAEKYYRLTRRTPLTQDELAAFINRQIVETRQSSKEAAALLAKMFPDTEIVYSKAANVNEFREKFKIVKVRALNDLHHAKDAYLNIVVGNVYNVKFGHDPKAYIKNKDVNGEGYDLKDMYKKDLPNAWSVASIGRILDTVDHNSCRIVKSTYLKTGKMFDANLISPSRNEKMLPQKMNGPLTKTEMYGGYANLTVAYFMLVRSGKRKKTLSLEPMTIYANRFIQDDEKAKIEYLTNECKLDFPEILIDKIKIGTLFNIDGSYAYLGGKSDKSIVWHNANEIWIDKENTKYLKFIYNLYRDAEKYRLKEIDWTRGVTKEKRGVTKEKNLALYDALVKKLCESTGTGIGMSEYGKKLCDSREKFEALYEPEQCAVIVEIVKLCKCDATIPKFEKLDLKSSALRLTKNLKKHYKMILTSPTGHYKKIVDFAKFL